MAAVSVSVVVPCFNYENFISKNIESLLEQSDHFAEIVIVDDGSTDGSWDRICAFGDRIETLRIKNSGPTTATFKGIDLTSSDFVIILDADDWLLPGAGARISEHLRPDIVKLQYDLLIADQWGNLTDRRYCRFQNTYGPSEIKRDFERWGTYHWPVTSGNVYSRWRLIEPLRALLSREMTIDGPANTLAPLLGAIDTINEPLAAYRHHRSSRSRGEGETPAVETIKALLKQREHECALLQAWEMTHHAPMVHTHVLENDPRFANMLLSVYKIEGVGGDIWSFWRTVFFNLRSILMRSPSWYIRFRDLVWLAVALLISGRQLERLLRFRLERTNSRSR